MIGWRLRKHYFRTTLRLPVAKTGNQNAKLVKSGSQPQAKQHQLQSSSQTFNGSLEIPNNSLAASSSELVLSWTEFGPDRYICDKEIPNIFKYLSELHHPFIEPCVYVTSNDSGALVIRKFYAQGSLKDTLCGSSPKNPFLGKELFEGWNVGVATENPLSDSTHPAFHSRHLTPVLTELCQFQANMVIQRAEHHYH